MSELFIVPQPKKLQQQGGSFQLDSKTCIQLLPDSAADLFGVASLLKQEILRATGLDLRIISSSRGVSTKSLIVVGVVGDASLERYECDECSLDPQAYCLKVRDDLVTAVGGDLEGACYALQTLRQIVRSAGAIWPTMTVEDWPSVAHRGLMLDVSRGKVPTLETLKLLVDTLAFFKMNVLQLYTEHTFAFASHPRIGENCGSLTPEDMLALDAFARERCLTLMPNLQAFGHCAHILRIPQYADLAESEALWSLSPAKEETYDLLGDMFADLAPAFSCKVLNVDCDETWDLGYGLSAEQCDERGRGQVYLEHIKRLHSLAAENGCRIQLWGDILLHYPELVGDLPEDVTLLDWHYGAADDYPSTRVFGESGRDFWVCPGTSSWNSIFPRTENANVNIRNLIRQGLEQGATGVLNTDWGDHGHYQPLGQSWYGYIYGAEQSWTGGETKDSVFDRAFGRVFFGQNGEDVVKAIRSVGALNALDDLARGNSSAAVFALLEDPVMADVAAATSQETINTVQTVCQQGRSVFERIPADAQDRWALEEMAYSCRVFELMARKVSFSQNLHSTLSGMPSSADEAVKKLDELVTEIDAIDAGFVCLAQELEQQWMRRARRSEIHISLRHLQGARDRMRLLRDWLQAQKQGIRQGETPDYDLTAYRADAKFYMMLGQAESKRWQELGIGR